MSVPAYDPSTARIITRERTGVVIPVYLPEGIDRRQGEALIEETAAAYCAQVSDPAAVCLAVDGAPYGAEAARGLAQKLGASLHVTPDNRGKLSAATHGVRTVMQNPDLDYVALVDQDGDHFAHELPNFVRAALHIAGQTGDDRACPECSERACPECSERACPECSERVLVLGRRISRHRPMGLLRGELEEFADRVLLDALAYRAAMAGRPLHLEYATTLDEFPDFHSGYKLFSRRTAQDVFLGPPRLAGVPEECYYRHAVEAVMVVEALEQGAWLGVVNRSTLNEQPISTFGLLNLSQLVADKIIWPCKRLDVPAPFVRQWMANHAPRLLLNTLAPAGKDELARIQERVLAAFGQDPGPDPPLQPLFV